mgnify:CR=1 FL=1
MGLKPTAINPAVIIGSMDPRKVRLQRETCDPAEVAATLAGAEVGAVVTFTGTVKGVTEAGAVERIEFSADEPAALAQMEACLVYTSDAADDSVRLVLCALPVTDNK